MNKYEEVIELLKSIDIYSFNEFFSNNKRSKELYYDCISERLSDLVYCIKDKLILEKLEEYEVLKKEFFEEEYLKEYKLDLSKFVENNFYIYNPEIVRKDNLPKIIIFKKYKKFSLGQAIFYDIDNMSIKEYNIEKNVEPFSIERFKDILNNWEKEYCMQRLRELD